MWQDFQTWLIQKFKDIKAAVTHIVIICLPPNFIFVILLVLHHGLSQVALVPSSKYYQKWGRNLSQNPPEDIILVPLVVIGSHDLDVGEAGTMNLRHSLSPSWKAGSAGEKKKEWLETGRKRQLGMMSNCLYPKMKHSFLALLKFGKTRTQLLRKDSHTPTKKNNLRWCSGSGPKTVPSDDVIFWSRTSDRLETRTGRSQSHSEQRGTTLSVFRRLQRLATKSRLESGEAGLLNSAN